MFKPLLRTSPLYSGNVKIACELRDYNRVDKNVYECNIRSAKLYPISHQLFQKNIECGLLGSSYEYDLRNFYLTYSNYFYDNCFEYPKEEMQIIDFAKSQYQRNTDFEYGVKRISYQKSGYQYAFFAPIYIESADDIPNTFVINLELFFGKDRMKLNKQIRINIASTKNSKNNYIYPYLLKYANKIDGMVCHISQDNNNAVYYGIDCVNGGFTKRVDNLISKILVEQNTINNFDASISLGFKHCQMAMKQIVPLCFMFNIDDILTNNELIKYANCNVVCSGYYLDSIYNKQSAFYDFSFNYDNFTQDIMQMDEKSGALKQVNTNLNICNQNFPCLNEAVLSDYQFSNKISPMFSRWKLKYSPDNYPYITNLNYAFSNNQNSIYKYREFPTNFLQVTSICNIIKNSEREDVFNFLFPLGTIGKSYYRKYLPALNDIVDKSKEDYIYLYFLKFIDHLDSESVLCKVENILNNIRDDVEKKENLANLYLELGFDERKIEENLEADAEVFLYIFDKSNNVILENTKNKPIKFFEAFQLLTEYYNIIEGKELNISLSEWYEGDKSDIKKQLNINIYKSEEEDFWEKLWNLYRGENQNQLFNLILEYSTREGTGEYYKKLSKENNSLINKYNFVRNNYGCDWFSVVEDLNNNWWKNAEWLDVVDNKVYYKGILYDINQVYNLLKTDEYEKIDKFGVFLYPNFKALSDEDYEEIIYSNWTLARTQNMIVAKNCNYNFDMVSQGMVHNQCTYIFENEDNTRPKTSEWQYNKQYRSFTIDGLKKEKYNISESTYYDEYIDSSKIIDSYGPIFISLENTNLEYSEINKYYDYSDIYNELYANDYYKNINSNQLGNTDHEIDKIANDYICEKIKGLNSYNGIISYELLPIHTSYMLVDKDIYQKISNGDVTYHNSIDLINPFGIYEGDDRDDTNIDFGQSEVTGSKPEKYENLNTRYLNNVLFYSDLEDQTIYRSYNDSNEASTYFYAGPLSLTKKEYGVNFYRKGNFVKSYDLMDIRSFDYSYNDIENFIKRHPDEYNSLNYPMVFTNYDEIGKSTLDYLTNRVGELSNIISNTINENTLDNLDEYQFNPICVDDNGSKYAFSIFTKRTPETSRFYGSYIDIENMPYDIDCLWVDEYNLYELALHTENPDQIIDLLSSDNSSTYKHNFFAKFLSKEHIYHWYNQLSKNYKLESIKDIDREWDKNIYIRLRRVVNNESVPEAYFNKYSYENLQSTFKISIKDEYLTLEKFLKIYGKKDSENNKYEYHKIFLDFYSNNLIYDSDNDFYRLKLYTKDGNFYYTDPIELVFNKNFVRLNKNLYDLIDIQSKEDYKDLYIYYIQSVKEYEEAYKNFMSIKFIDLQGKDNPKDIIEEERQYKYFVNHYLGEFRNIDQCLAPLFNDIFKQPRNNTQLYSAKILQRITKTNVYQDNKKNIIDSIYRYNKSTDSIVIELVQNDIDQMVKIPENYEFLKIEEDGKVRIRTPFEYYTGNKLEDCLLKPYSVCKIDFYQDPKYDQLNYISNDKFKNENISLNTIVDENGTKYGFYLIKLDFDNTVNSFDLRSIEEIVNQQTGNIHYNFNQKINFFKYMNSYNIVDKDDPEYYHNYPAKVIKELLPFIKIQPLNLLNKMSCLVNPKMYNLVLLYNTIPFIENNKNIKERKIIFQNSNNRQSLLRYMNSIVPYIPQSNGVVKNQYSLKFKNIQGDILETGKLNSIGDSVIYQENLYIDKYHPIKVFTVNNAYNQGNNNPNSEKYNKFYHVKSYNMNILDFSPFEYKHYNCSKVINTPTLLEYKYPNNVYYEKLEELESEENTYKIFKSLISTLLNTLEDNVKENFAKYLYERYSVEYDTVSVGLDLSKTNKIYRLIYRFKLL